MTEESDISMENKDIQHYQSLLQKESYTCRRPRLHINDWININDFKKSNDPTGLQDTYKTKEQLNKLLNDTYVAMEKAEEINGWSSRKKRSIIEWKNIIEFRFIVNWFFVYDLKNKEGWWAWLIIVISTITSTLSLIRPTNIYLKMLSEGFLSFFSIITTLIAAWLKKQNYVDRIKNIDRYIQKLSKLNVELDYAVTKPPWERKSYDKFVELYETEIVQLLSSSPPMSPEEFKTAVWQLTNFYPELIKNTYPWYDKTENGNYVITDWGDNILKTYDAVYYSSTFRRIFSCYYCTCRCISGNSKRCCGERKNYITDLYENGSYNIKLNNENWLPPQSESLTKQFEEDNFSMNIANNLNMLSENNTTMRNGENIIEMARQMEKEKQRQKVMEMEKQRQKEMEMEKQRQKVMEMEKQRQKEMEKQRQKEMEMEKQRQKEKEMEKQRQKEMEKQRQKEMEKQRQMEMKKEDINV